MIAEFISPSDPRWAQLLEHAEHDFYHLPEYAAFSARHEGGTPIAFYAESENSAFLVPLLVRPVPAALGATNGLKDATTPYGYPSPILIPAADSFVLKRFLRAFQKAGAKQEIITAFFRLHPLLPLPADALVEHGEIVRHGQTVSIDLSRSYEEIWSQTRENHRRNIRKLLEAGFQAEMDHWDFYEEFVAVYRQTMKRLSANEFYFFAASYFTDLRRSFGDHLHMCTVLSPDGQVAAAGVFTSVNGIVQYHLGGTAEPYLDYAPSKLMFDHVRGWAKAEGNRAFHLGGGVGARADSLFQFKAGFSKLRSDFYTYRMVLDEKKYAELNRLWQGRCAKSNGGDPHFFPRYRQL